MPTRRFPKLGLAAVAQTLSCGALPMPHDANGSGGYSETGPVTQDVPTSTNGDLTIGTGDSSTIGLGGSSDTNSMHGSESDTEDMVEFCKSWTQDCPDGKKCAPFLESDGGGWSAKCVPIMGAQQPGEPCVVLDHAASGLDNCIEGATCWFYDESLVGTCLMLCLGLGEFICTDISHCALAADGVVNLCIPDCNPLIQDCPDGDLCIPVGSHFECILDASRGGGQFNDSCEFDNACAKGLVCLDTAAASIACDPQTPACCQPFCNFPDGACPNPDQKCRQWYDPLQLPEDDPRLAYGVCSIGQP